MSITKPLSKIVSITSARLLGDGRSRYRLLGPRCVTVMNQTLITPIDGHWLASSFIAGYLDHFLPAGARSRHPDSLDQLHRWCAGQLVSASSPRPTYRHA